MAPATELCGLSITLLLWPCMRTTRPIWLRNYIGVQDLGRVRNGQFPCWWTVTCMWERLANWSCSDPCKGSTTTQGFRAGDSPAAPSIRHRRPSATGCSIRCMSYRLEIPNYLGCSAYCGSTRLTVALRQL